MTSAGSEPRVIRFRGKVLCGRGGEGPLGLVLVGITEDRPEEAVHVAFSCPAPDDLPAELMDAKLELFGGNRHRITVGGEALNRRAAEREKEQEGLNRPDAEREKEQEGEGSRQLRSGELRNGELRSWSLQGAVHVHREVLTAFYRALPPRPVPLRKRLFWNVMLALAANPLSRRLLLRGR